MPKVLYEKRDRIAYVTLNRPEARNAVDPETHELLWSIWEDFSGDDSVDVAILTGAGDAFCAGADLKTFIPPWIESATPDTYTSARARSIAIPPEAPGSGRVWMMCGCLPETATIRMSFSARPVETVQ